MVNISISFIIINILFIKRDEDLNNINDFEGSHAKSNGKELNVV